LNVKGCAPDTRPRAMPLTQQKMPRIARHFYGVQGNESEYVPCGHLHEVLNELELGGFTELGNGSAARDNETEWT
jgi:hypothetical protein